MVTNGAHIGYKRSPNQPPIIKGRMEQIAIFAPYTNAETTLLQYNY